MLDTAVEALCLRGAHKVAHSGRTLLEHLAGTYNLLRAWKSLEDVALAGLYHSVYGAKHLPFSLFSGDERAEVRQLIGFSAESLVYTYSKLESRWWLRSNPQDVILQNNTPADLYALSLISLANLKELESSPVQEISSEAERQRLTLEDWRRSLVLTSVEK